jgi:hypothetical protein
VAGVVSTFGATGAAKNVKNFRFLRLSGTLLTVTDCDSDVTF